MSTQPGHPFIGKQNEYQQQLGPNRHTAWYASPISVVWQCKLVSGLELRKRRWAPPYGPYDSRRTLLQVRTCHSTVRTWIALSKAVQNMPRDDTANTDRHRLWTITMMCFLGWIYSATRTQFQLSSKSGKWQRSDMHTTNYQIFSHKARFFI